MKQTRDKNIDKPLKLPQITSKTSTSFSTETSNSRIRPSSSSKLNELEKNLFSQLNDYEDLSKREIKKSKTRKDIEPDASKQLTTDWLDLQAPYLKKIEKIMPEAYLKLLEARKAEPLQQANNKARPKKLVQAQPKQTKLKQKKTVSKQQKRESSFSVAEREVEQIYQQYLQDEGLVSLNDIKSEDLKQLNSQIIEAQTDINSLRQSMYDIIQKVGNNCLNIQ